MACQHTQTVTEDVHSRVDSSYQKNGTYYAGYTVSVDGINCAVHGIKYTVSWEHGKRKDESG
jgi:hypothetical protein